MPNDNFTEKALATVDSIIAMIGDETDSVKAGKVFQRWLEVQKSFWSYSFSNVMLIAYQAKVYGFQAFRVAGFQAWKKLLDYRNHGGDAGLCLALEGEYTARGVSLSYISAKEMARTCPGAKGFSRGSEVCVLDTLTGAEKAGTLAHELAHSLLHFKDGDILDLEHSRSTLEIEAESISATILGAWGLEWRASCFYIAAWQGNKDAIRASMTRIANTSKSILSSILSDNNPEV